MSTFGVYFDLGFKHIANREALDHILFMAALALRYQFSDWKKVLVLVTAFTIGHTISLLLAVFNVLNLPSNWVEFFIAVTIVCTAMSNLWLKKFVYKTKFPPIYFFTLFFGLVHGLGFSNGLKELVGTDAGAVLKILYANVGIEAAQLMFVFIVLLISLICTNLIKLNRREYILIVSGAILGIALQMAYTRLPFLNQ